LDQARRLKVSGRRGVVDMGHFLKIGLAPVSVSEPGQTHPLPDRTGITGPRREPMRLDAVANELQ
jgi:hypothetical protein